MSDDITHEILLHVWDRRDLLNFISCSKHYYSTFGLYPNVILRRVVCNETGVMEEVLPYAWATRRCTVGGGQLLGRPPSIGEDVLTVDMDPEDVRRLKENQIVVSRVARAYSVRLKDSLQIQDTLTYEESRRIHTTIYIYWQYCILGEGTEVTKSRSDDDSEEDDHFDSDSDSDSSDSVGNRGDQPSDVQTADSKCMAFLVGLSTTHLLWLESFLIKFLARDVEITLGAELDAILDNAQAFVNHSNHGYQLSDEQWLYYALAAGPSFFGNWSKALPPYKMPSPSFSQRCWLKDFLGRVLRQRSIDTQSRSSAENVLVSKPAIIVEACQKCRGSPDFYNPLFLNITNLADFALSWRPGDLPGRLATNPVEMRRLARRVYGPTSQPDPTNNPATLKVVTEIVDHALVRAQLSLAGGSNQANNSSALELSDDESAESDEDEENSSRLRGYKWSPLDPLCGGCFAQEFREFYYAWWLEERESDRVEAHQFNDLCWWGFECRTQRGQEHAAKLDHCCPRTRQPRDVAP